MTSAKAKQSISKSIELMARAKKFIPGGVNSPVRAYGHVNETTRFIKSGKGAYIFDVDGNKYIDYVCSWGPLILGHGNPYVIKSISERLINGTSFGASTEVEIELAEKITNLIPSIEMVRMVNSGTEATMSAIRLARGYTKKNKIIKFTGCYHGHNDSLLIESGSGVMTLNLPSSAGIPNELVCQTLLAPFNDIQAVTNLFAKHANDIAAIILEPIPANINLILPKNNFLHALRDLCNKYSSLLIFDEVITGFRVGMGGAQELYEVHPDLTCLGKIIGGGLPVGAFGGKEEIMSQLAPLGPVYQAGTLSGNPVAMNAGLATISYIQQQENFYSSLSSATNILANGLKNIAIKYSINLDVQSETGILGIQFLDDPEHLTFKKFFSLMLKNGVYLAPSPYEVTFLSSAHTKEIISQTLDIADNVMKEL